MLIIESWLDSHLWKINEKDLKRFLNYEKFVVQKQNQFDENEIKNFVSKYIHDELNEKFYNQNLSIQLSQNISTNLCKKLSNKYKFYKIIIQTFIGKISNEKSVNINSHNFKLYASYHMDPRTDKCFSIMENNGHM